MSANVIRAAHVLICWDPDHAMARHMQQLPTLHSQVLSSEAGDIGAVQQQQQQTAHAVELCPAAAVVCQWAAGNSFECSVITASGL